MHSPNVVSSTVERISSIISVKSAKQSKYTDSMNSHFNNVYIHLSHITLTCTLHMHQIWAVIIQSITMNINLVSTPTFRQQYKKNNVDI